jgi:hypothetical protein
MNPIIIYDPAKRDRRAESLENLYFRGQCQINLESKTKYEMRSEMLGEQIGESHGKRTGRRALSADSGFKVEVSFEESGKMLGIEANGFGTYTSAPRPDGTLYGEGQGVVITKDGDMATWKGAGVGRFVGGGAVSYRGALYYSTTSPKLARLNSIVVVFEYEVDASGNTHTKSWEWK